MTPNKIHLFVLVPQHVETGPVKGAIAVCNFLCDFMNVTFCVVKGEIETVNSLRPQVSTATLGSSVGMASKILTYRSLLKQASTDAKVVSLSMCFSADLVNLFTLGIAKRVSSVRGNLLANYGYDYGFKGIGLAFIHLLFLNFLDSTLAMSETMIRQLRFFGHFRTPLIRNFIDESWTHQSAQQPNRVSGIKNIDEYKIVLGFVGSLSTRKRADLLLRALSSLNSSGVSALGILIGSGPLESELKQMAIELGIQEHVLFLGHQSNPLSELKICDYMVLPSQSEGVPRAALESLFIGVPCILRDVDANHELVKNVHIGRLFKSDSDFMQLILELGKTNIRTSNTSRPANLLPIEFSQDNNCRKLLEIIRNV